jgi:hypothetical protein
MFSARRGLTSIPTSGRFLFRPDTWQIRGLPEQLTFGTGDEDDPAVASSGRIVFESWFAEEDVWSLPVDTNQGKKMGEMKRLTHRLDRQRRPSISRDGKSLIFLSRGAVWHKDLHKDQERVLAKTPAGSSPAFPVIAPDGSKVAYGHQ